MPVGYGVTYILSHANHGTQFSIAFRIYLKFAYKSYFRSIINVKLIHPYDIR